MIPVSGLLARVLLSSVAVCMLMPAGASEQTRIGGHEYVRLTDWVRERNLSIQWIKRDEIAQLANATTKLRLEVHSPEAQINGVAVRLLFPLASRGDGIYISRLDLQTTFGPVLWPPKSRGKAIKTICLDPGHGGKDPGFRVGSNQEKRYTLLLAQELREELTKAGYTVSLTRTHDTFLELPDRPEVARRRKADLFISLHFNAAEASASSVQGAEVYCLTPAGAPSTNARGEGGGAGWFAGNRFNEQNILLAYQLQKTLTRTLPAEDRGVHRARFAVLRDATMPAVLIEAGFMSHPVEGHKIFSSAYRRQIARAIVDGVNNYKTLISQ
ncbi:MAG TPA: N-acetylmuramoyl-L-alanine amidase [Candidatus Limnocylindrales bacterium]|nr:N-acetylmuramoyl-L-alanine amidase [Candidatus Limnocylindrales bacterium]